MKKSDINYIVLFITLILVSCKKKDEFPPSLATVNTVAVSSITGNSAVSGGTIVSDGNTEIIKAGICYSTKVNPTLADKTVIYAGNADSYLLTMTGLTGTTTYHVRAFVTNNMGTAYGTNEEIFTTSVSLASVQTSTITSITSTTALCKSVITNGGGGSIISKGVCYNILSNPTLQNFSVTTTATTDTFSVNLIGLDTNRVYYARAFATNAAGTIYGNELIFSTTKQIFALGENYQGGIIFYLDGSGTHGLVASLSDQSTNAAWGCFGTSIAGASGLVVGSGTANTANIETGCTTSGVAADICSNLTLGGYTDWVLPSKDELALMYQNLHSNSLGGFSNYSYWSSTQYDDNNSWSYNFGTNALNTSNKNSPYSVRAIRAF
jgi:hypothetical protein